MGLGHPIGPNADQIFVKLSYNLSSRVKFNLEYQKIRKGENIVSDSGRIIKNVGGDIFTPYRYGVDPDQIYFLDGIRINTQNILFNVLLEPLKNYYFDLNYVYNIDNNLTYATKNYYSYAYARFSLNF